MTCKPYPKCHRCPEGVLEFLRTDLPFAPKVMSLRREEVIGLRFTGVRGVVPGGVIEWDEDGSNVRAGPNVRHYEACRKECCEHLLFMLFG